MVRFATWRWEDWKRKGAHYIVFEMHRLQLIVNNYKIVFHHANNLNNFNLTIVRHGAAQLCS